MDTKQLWQQKLLQLLHDPPGKAFFLRAGAGGHKAVAKDLFQRITEVPLRFVPPEPDYVAAGADRPVTSPPSRTSGISPVAVDWVTHPVITHPLASGEHGRTDIDFSGVDRPRTQAGGRALASEVAHTLEEIVQRHAVSEEEALALEEVEHERRARAAEVEIAKHPVWDDEPKLIEACLQLWRLAPESDPGSLNGVLWEVQPADSRAPDHSLWDHTRITSALAFLSGRKREQGAAMPWLVAFSIGPVQTFIAQSRTGTDLWTSSMLLSDLVWHAMVPFVERYGPDAIVYPDLRRNPRADLWLLEQQKKGRWRNVLRETENPCSYAGIFPNTFIALVPRGGDGALELLENVADEGKMAVQKRWMQLAELARAYWDDRDRILGVSMTPEERRAIGTLWDRQHKDVLFAVWSAVAWPPLEAVDDPEALAIREALPGQTPAPALTGKEAKAVRDWHARHGPWLPVDALARYAAARYVYARTNRRVHQCQRGFDYAPVHHALHARHALRKAEAHRAVLDGEAGEKCTLCGIRQALGLPAGWEDRAIDAQREAVRAFWRKHDPTSEGGAERLCAVCTMKRVLIRAGAESEHGDSKRRRMAGLTAAWAGPETPMAEVQDDDGGLRVPFPSTATMATQGYVCAVAKEPRLDAAVAEVVRCAEAAELPHTTFARALRPLAEAHEAASGTGQRFLQFEAEMTVFPEVLASAARRTKTRPDDSDVRDRRGRPIDERKLGALGQAVSALRMAASDLNRRAQVAGEEPPIPSPGAQVALIALDGDNLRKLLVGTCIGARWRDVIHPQAIEAFGKNAAVQQSGWRDLLGRRRLMGPSTHAFVNRVLATFAHTVVPWVVEREFSGRLIYAGGDDVLAIAPAAEALDLAARLSQLYSAAWIVDTRPGEAPWEWRRKRARIVEGARAADRFAVIATDKETATPWPIPAERTQPPVYDEDWPRTSGASGPVGGRLMPMMGPGQTLSAGIAVGHYKTPLGSLVRAAWEERDRAKGEHDRERNIKPITARNAFAIRRFSRAGEKASLRFAWGERGHAPDRALAGYVQVRRAINAFRDRTLAARLPYKLRQVEQAVFAAWLHEAKEAPPEAEARAERLAKGLFARECGADAQGPAEAAFAIWWSGLRCVFYASRADAGMLARASGAEAGLAVCRFLGALGREEEK